MDALELLGLIGQGETSKVQFKQFFHIQVILICNSIRESNKFRADSEIYYICCTQKNEP